jgi:diguanylate cyclase (GGDEF)-like protein
VRELAFGITLSTVLMYVMLALVTSRVRREPAHGALRRAGVTGAAGLVLSLLQGIAPPVIPFVGGNMLLAVAVTSLWDGTAQLVGAKPLPRAIWLLPVAVGVGGLVFGVLWPSLGGRLLATFGCLAMTSGATAVTVLRRAGATTWPGLARAVGLLYALAFLAVSLRVGLFVALGVPRATVFEADLRNAIPFVAVLVLYALILMSLNVVVVTRLMDELRALARRDPLTGLLNRLGLRDVIDARLATQPDAAAALLLMDLDRFKAVNDEHGHEVGDRLLVRFAEVLTTSLRDGDVGVRLGGEEFAVLSPNPDPLTLAERIRSAFARPHPGLPPSSVSIGLIERTPLEGVALRAAFKAADAALYRAKAEGRDRVVCAQA